MKIASFNVENLFNRAGILNQDNTALIKKTLKAVASLNGLLEEVTYTAAIKQKVLALLKELDLEKSDTGDFVILRQNRGQLLARPRNKPIEVKATGRSAWIGWAELKTAPVNEVAMMNTGRVIRDVDADIFAVVETENRTSLKQFSETVLEQVGGKTYHQFMLIDGNDERGIDVGIMTREGYSIGKMQSHIHDLMPNGQPIYSRDCPEYAVTAPEDELVWVLPNHFKSKFGGDSPASKAKRKAQATKTAEIYNRLRSEGNQHIIILGDLNDTPDSEPIGALLNNTDLKDISAHPSFDTGEFSGKGTFGLGNDSNKIDYILLSPALFSRVTACGIFRKGAWPGKNPRRWTVYDELKDEIHAASDHHAVWVEIEPA